jgi:hypothetical protein
VSKRIASLAVALALVIGGAIGFAWHAPGRSSTWANIRTWVGFAVIVIGVVIALVQLDLQRRQLAGQHKVIQEEVERNKQRDALISGQLKELEQRALTFERQQADAIGLRPSTFGIRVPGSQPSVVRSVHLADVLNDSQRPIRNVACRIEPEQGEALQAAHQVGLYVSFSSGPHGLPLSDGTHIPLVRAGETAGFVFDVEEEQHPKARMTARFTDDASLHWQICPDLHLEKLGNRDW